jgi:polyisoprenyl-teichoic acid--peptidoglycan teichoic acid transferase
MNFSRRNNPKKQPPSAVDGFIRAGERPRRSSAMHGMSRNTEGNTSFSRKPSSYANFRSSDGFHPKDQTNMHGSKGSSLHDDVSMSLPTPLDLTLPDPGLPPKRRRLIFKHAFWQKKGAKFVVAVLLVGLLSGGYLFGKGFLTAREILRGGGGSAALSGDLSQLNGEGDGRVNILLLGKGGDDHEGADLTDTILIASVDPIHKKAAILSIPRDLYIQPEGYGAMKINAVYATARNEALNNSGNRDQVKQAEAAGFKALEKAIERTIGLPIHYHASIDFEGFKKAVDAVGGVQMNVAEPVYERMAIDGRSYVLNVQPGLQEFDGQRALAYSRSRYTSTRGDFSRSERQRALLVALKDRIFTLGTLSNPAKINQLMNAFGGRIQTNLGIEELLRLYEIGQQINTNEIDSIGLADPPNEFLTTTMLNGQSVVIPRAGVNDYQEIQNFVRNTLRDGFIANEDATIAVYNGTYVAGLAARTAENLKSYGYSVGEVADAPTKGYKETVIVDMRDGNNKFTRRYLENRFRTKMVTNLPDTSIAEGSADFVIILGQNEISRLEN